jgi:UDPglucose 6-dehydrogenase
MSALSAPPRIGYAAMTHLGLNSAVAAAAKGFETVCFDADPALIDRLGKGDLAVIEPDLPELLANNRARLAFTAEVADLTACDVVYLALDVPTDDAGTSDLTGLDRLLELVIPALGPKATPVVLSQVPPGFTRARLRPGLDLYYQVETLIFGRAMERALHPERFIVGCADPAQPLPPALQAYLQAFGCPILPMRLESAELTKIAINCCLVSSISVANTLAELCEGIGAVWGEIAPALKLDRRIGQHAYLTPGLGIAGGNLERDLATVIRLSEEIGSDAGVVRAWIANSRHRRDWAARTIQRVLLDKNPGATVAVWGLAYKENTNSAKNSPSLATLRQLPDVRLVLHDPVVPASAAGHARATGVVEPLQAVAGADALMILTPWPQYKGIPPAAIAQVMRGKVVLDPYGVLDARAAREAGLDYHTLGRGADV